MRQQGINGLRSVHAGSCHAWPLPADATCATVARQVFRDAVSEVRLEPDLRDCYRGRRHGSAPSTATSRASERLSARQAARELEAMLDERGFGGGLVRADQPASDMSVLSVCRGLTVWCRSGVVSMTSPEGDRERWSYADMVEAAEQTVRRYEELELGLDLAAAGA